MPQELGERDEIHFIHAETSLGLLTLVHPLLQLGHLGQELGYFTKIFLSCSLTCAVIQPEGRTEFISPGSRF